MPLASPAERRSEEGRRRTPPTLLALACCGSRLRPRLPARRSTHPLLAAALAALLVAAPADGAAPDGRGERLSRPGVLSRWAFVERPTVARRAPLAYAGPVARLGLFSEDRTSELVLALERMRDDGGRWWVRARLPTRRSNVTGWLPRASLGPFHRVTTWLRIDRRRLRATLVREGRVAFRAPIGIGRAAYPTPAGFFYVRNSLSGFPSGSIYGAHAFGTSAKSPTLTDWPGGGVIGIHGTNRPQLIPGRISHGCIRLRNHDILRLRRLMPVGTPITIS